MKLIVGLGNPDKEYDNTRHNIGFRYIDNYANSMNVTINKNKFNGLFQELNINNEKVFLLKPLSYMNLSGIVVRSFVEYYKIDLKDILIIQDDLDMNLGKIKIKYSGSCGGHNGIRNISENLKSDDYLRLKVGISNDKSKDTKDYVLSKFNKEEQELLNKRNEVINNIINDFINNTPKEIIMGRYNGVKNEDI